MLEHPSTTLVITGSYNGLLPDNTMLLPNLTVIYNQYGINEQPKSIFTENSRGINDKNVLTIYIWNRQSYVLGISELDEQYLPYTSACISMYCHGNLARVEATPALLLVNNISQYVWDVELVISGRIWPHNHD